MSLNYPVSDYYKEFIVDGVTINRSETWWTAMLVIKNPKSEKKFLNLYKWNKRNGEWKIAQSFKINSLKNVKKISDELKLLEIHLKNDLL